MAELKEKHKIFADKYIETLNITESAKFAGFKESTAAQQGSRLFNNVEIQNYIKERMASKEPERIASQDEVLEYLTKVMRGEVNDQLGFEAPVKDRNKAAELLGKRHGLFTDKIEHSGEVNLITVKPPKFED